MTSVLKLSVFASGVGSALSRSASGEVLSWTALGSWVQDL